MADIWSEKDVGFIGPITFLSDLTVGPTYFAKEGHIALHMSVGMLVALNLVQLITPERFAREASNLVGR